METYLVNLQSSPPLAGKLEVLRSPKLKLSLTQPSHASMSDLVHSLGSEEEDTLTLVIDASLSESRSVPRKRQTSRRLDRDARVGLFPTHIASTYDKWNRIQGTIETYEVKGEFPHTDSLTMRHFT